MSNKVQPRTLEALEDVRKYLHQHPEVSNNEHHTAGRISEELKALGPDHLYQNVGGTGLLAVFEGPEAGPTILFRAELDALPIEEENDFEYRSGTPGVSHKCGHDGHMCILLGLGRRIHDNRPKKGRVVLLFQPAEEIGAGAHQVLEDEQFRKIEPDWVFALHNLPGYPMGAIVTREGAFSAAVTSLIVRLHGKTAHAGEPENGIHPGPAIVTLLSLAEKLTQPDLEREDFTLVTPIHIRMGEKAYGVSPGYGEVHFTMRTWRMEPLENIKEQMLSAVIKLRSRYVLRVETEWTNPFETNYNDAEAVKWIRSAATKCEYQLIERKRPLKWGEDFGAFTQRYRGAMFGLGSGKKTPALHNPDYDFPDAIIPKGVQIFYSLVEKILG